ncbi:hypothetical protein [Geitlerinema sp. PCC 7407]|uniref:hypothetical protein n=1 Tax=Geitlerinema sp. PCC 7407 TaxID=1173025 RepID=UPI0002F2A371|nr:hypothetical protein [Geitlerinema sp. PCC 7407]
MSGKLQNFAEIGGFCGFLGRSPADEAASLSREKAEEDLTGLRRGVLVGLGGDRGCSAIF